MAADRCPCPACGASVDPTLIPPGSKVRCPQCHLTVYIPTGDGEPVELLQSQPRKWSPDAPAARKAGRGRPEPQVRSGGGWSLLAILLVVVLLGLGGVMLVGGAGVIVAVYWLNRVGPPDQPLVAQVEAPPAPGVAAPAARPEPPAEPPPPLPANGALPFETLERLKNATAFLKVDVAGGGSATGTGFLVQTDKDTGYLVSNHHVIAPEMEADFPGPRFGPRFGMGRVTPRVLGITAVFRSGTAQESSVRAEVVTSDPADDLAVLRVANAVNLPAPIDLRQEPRLVETMPLFAFGFPFGEALARHKGNPAITVSKSSVSSLRRDDRGELAIVQIDGELNPGNSGGPVVDAQGRLVGVAVAKIRNTAIGMAVPFGKLRTLLNGRISGGAISVRKIENGTAQVVIEARLVDPFARLQAPALHHAPAKPGQALGGNAPLAEAQKVDLVRDGAKASATISVSVNDRGEGEFVFQFSYREPDGRVQYTPARSHRLTAAAQKPPQPPGPAVGQNVPERPSVPPLLPPPANADELTRLLHEARAQGGFPRYNALGRLAQMEAKKDRVEEVRKALEPLLADPDSRSRSATAKALVKLAPLDSLPAVLKLLEDENTFVRWDVCEALSSVKDERAAEGVARRLEHDGLKAGPALRAMGPVAEKAVAGLLKNGNDGVRVEACRILEVIGTGASDAVLRELAGQNNAPGWAAAAALKGVELRWPLPPDELGKAIDGLKGDDAKRGSSARRLSATTPDVKRRDDVLRGVAGMLENPNKELRAAAVRVLGKWGAGEDVPTLVRLAEDRDGDVRWATFDALVLLKDERGAVAVAKRLENVRDRNKAGEALRAMGPVGEKETRKYIAVGKNHFVRREACAVLKVIGTKDSVPALEEASKDGDPFVAGDAKNALVAILTRR